MTRFQALYIKYCRVRCENSWRIVHSNYQKRYVPKEDWYINPVLEERRIEWINKTTDEKAKSDIISLFGRHPHGNQITGRELCRQAQDLLKENWEDEC